MRFLIAGPGAVGGFVAARLADGGQDVTVLARSHRAGQLRDNGLRLASQGAFQVRQLLLTEVRQLIVKMTNSLAVHLGLHALHSGDKN